MELEVRDDVLVRGDVRMEDVSWLEEMDEGIDAEEDVSWLEEIDEGIDAEEVVLLDRDGLWRDTGACDIDFFCINLFLDVFKKWFGTSIIGRPFLIYISLRTLTYSSGSSTPSLSFRHIEVDAST